MYLLNIQVHRNKLTLMIIDSHARELFKPNYCSPGSVKIIVSSAYCWDTTPPSLKFDKRPLTWPALVAFTQIMVRTSPAMLKSRGGNRITLPQTFPRFEVRALLPIQINTY